MDYEINNETLVIMPFENNKSYIMETDAEYYIPSPTMKVIKHSCEYFGSSYEGRSFGTSKLLGIHHKTPIIIEETNNIVFFPTTSPKNNDCVWLSCENISNFYKNNETLNTVVEFKNKQKIELAISVHSFSNQYLRSCRLKSVIFSRKALKK